MHVQEIMNRSYPLLYEDELVTKARATLRNRGLMRARKVDVGQAAKLMWEKKIGALQIVEDEKLVGMITERDFFKLVLTE